MLLGDSDTITQIQREIFPRYWTSSQQEDEAATKLAEQKESAGQSGEHNIFKYVELIQFIGDFRNHINWKSRFMWRLQHLWWCREQNQGGSRKPAESLLLSGSEAEEGRKEQMKKRKQI